MTENKGDLISREALKETIIKICGKCSNNITEYDENHIPNGNCAIWHILNMIDNAPTVEPAFKPIAEVKFDKEQLQEIVDKAKAEVLASIERPQGEWIMITEYDGFIHAKCSVCNQFNDWGDVPFCPWCGADMRPNPNQLRDCENCVHHSDNGCEVWKCEFEKRSDV